MEQRTYPKGTLRICLDEWIDGKLSGRIYTKFRDKPAAFQSLGEILLRGEEIFDEAGYPMKFQQKRTFNEATAQRGKKRKRGPFYLSDQELEEKRGRIKTVDIVVTTRRHSTWQGILLEQDGSAIGKFGSELELLKMITKISIGEADFSC